MVIVILLSFVVAMLLFPESNSVRQQKSVLRAPAREAADSSVDGDAVRQVEEEEDELFFDAQPYGEPAGE